LKGTSKREMVDRKRKVVDRSAKLVDRSMKLVDRTVIFVDRDIKLVDRRKIDAHYTGKKPEAQPQLGVNQSLSFW
jgi:hypothetical protein